MNSFIDKFNFIDPDEDSYKFNFLSFSEWTSQIEYVKLSNNVGYWVGPHPFVSDADFELFKNTISKYPICKTNNHDNCLDPNPFATIHIPGWLADPVCAYVKDFYLSNTQINVSQEVFSEWGNIYIDNVCKPIRIFRMPHIDAEYGLVSNMWFSTDQDGYGTKLYEYKGKIIDGKYDFMVDQSHKLYKWWQTTDKQARLPAWENFEEIAENHLGFECVGVAPATDKTMTMYLNSTPHTPYISKDIDFRWSHTFSYVHQVHTIQKLSDL